MELAGTTEKRRKRNSKAQAARRSRIRRERSIFNAYLRRTEFGSRYPEEEEARSLLLAVGVYGMRRIIARETIWLKGSPAGVHVTEKRRLRAFRALVKGVLAFARREGFKVTPTGTSSLRKTA